MLSVIRGLQELLPGDGIHLTEFDAGRLSAAARSFPVVLCLSILPDPAVAYIGPGTGMGAFAVELALGAGLLLLIVVLVWYPVKRMIKPKRNGHTENEPAELECSLA